MEEVFMKISEIKTILNAELICGEEHLDWEIYNACGSDMMSDVLAYVKEQAVLLSGLVNPQVVRTACKQSRKQRSRNRRYRIR